MKTLAIILAGGSGQRFGRKTPKQFLKINKKMVLEYTLDIFQKSKEIDEILIATPKEFLNKIIKLKSAYPKIKNVVIGGTTRKESCLNALKIITTEEDTKILIHNAVQPCLSLETIEDCVKALDEYECLSVGIPSVYTIMKLNEKNFVEEICTRELSYIDQGPECFRLNLLRKIFSINDNNDSSYTNFTAFVKANNLANVYMIKGNRENIKLTYPEDLNQIRNYLNKN